MADVEGRFSHKKDQLSLFFERYIRGPHKEVCGIGVRDTG
jgi:hypothetical protein